MEKKLFYFSYGGTKPFGKYLPLKKNLYVNFKKGTVYGISIIKDQSIKKFTNQMILHIKNHGPNYIIVRVEKKLYDGNKTLVKSLNGYSSRKIVVNMTNEELKKLKEITTAVFLEDQENDDPITISIDKIELK